MCNPFKKWFQKYNTIDELMEAKKTPEELCWWVEQNIWWVKEKTDVWQSPERTFRTRKGDCDCVSILLKYMLSKMGYKTWFLTIRPTKEVDYNDFNKTPHAVCVFEYKGKLWHCSNWGLKETPATFIGDVPQYVFPNNPKPFGMGLWDDEDIKKRIDETGGR